MGLFGYRERRVKATTVVFDGKTFGASPDRRGPVGGGKGYRGYPRPTHAVDSLDSLLAALKSSHTGDIIFIPGSCTVECTERVYIEEMVLEIPAGVTLMSDRGKARSKGALLTSGSLQTRPLIRALGSGVRVTGIRIAGPNPRRSLEHHHRSFAEGRGHDYYYGFPVSSGIQTEHPNLMVDNCELAGWSHSAVHLLRGSGHHIHHNLIHHNEYQGLGYGVCHDLATSLIERNLFNHNRHSIAGTGLPGCGYTARHNVEQGTSLSHCFDMHGGRDRKDGTNLAGSTMVFTNNTFWCPKPAIKIRGVSEEAVRVSGNWFYQGAKEKAVIQEGNVRFGKNAYGRHNPQSD